MSTFVGPHEPMNTPSSFSHIGGKREHPEEAQPESAPATKKDKKQKKDKKDKKQKVAEEKADPPRHEQEKQKRAEEQAALTSRPTVTFAVPGSIIANAQTEEMKAYLAGSIARACAVFRADEVVVYADAARREMGTDDKNAIFLARILQYLETPQYLRRSLYPVHRDLRNIGLTNPTDMPHHVRFQEWSDYREGVVVARPAPKGSNACYVNVGLKKEALVHPDLQVGVRVTVRLDKKTQNNKVLRGVAVAPSEPRDKGTYWGYQVRVAADLASVWSECPFEEGYDYSLGTSQNGHDVIADREWALPAIKHMMIVFGGLGGLEEVVESDHSLPVSPDQVSTLFDSYVNVCPEQGSRTIRTEEAILVCMASIQYQVNRLKSGTG